MTEFRVKKRETGATATLKRNGHPQLSTPTGGALSVVTAASEPGFNPLDLLYSSLAACLVLSARIAASQMGVLDRFEKAEARVNGEKSEGEAARIIRFEVRLTISGAFDEEMKQTIAHKAEDICTVSNTLRGDAEFNVTID
jgi:uncharacterized OsmC-like protein